MYCIRQFIPKCSEGQFYETEALCVVYVCTDIVTVVTRFREPEPRNIITELKVVLKVHIERIKSTLSIAFTTPF